MLIIFVIHAIFLKKSFLYQILLLPEQRRVLMYILTTIGFNPRDKQLS
jgi:hypothetical protein